LALPLFFHDRVAQRRRLRDKSGRRSFCAFIAIAVGREEELRPFFFFSTFDSS
jgi:hypothetical protein